mgnify:CR=1 FL=1
MGNKEIIALIKIWQNFTEAQSGIKLNPNIGKVRRLAKGVLENEKNHGLKFCPCRLTSGNLEEDLKLVCPCNFFIQKTWQEKKECWCGLFLG